MTEIEQRQGWEMSKGGLNNQASVLNNLTTEGIHYYLGAGMVY